MQDAVSLARGAAAREFVGLNLRDRTFISHGLRQMALDGAVVLAMAELIPLPASWHFRLACGASLAVLTAGLVGAHGGYGELAGAGRRQIERCVGLFILALAMLRVVAGLMDRGGLISSVWLAADALGTSALLTGLRLAHAPAGKPSGTVVILGGAADHDGVEAAIAARGLSGGVAGALSLAGAAASASGGAVWPLIHQAHLRGILRGGRIRDVVFVGRPEAAGRGDEIFGDLFREVFAVPARIWLALDVAAMFPGALHGRAGRYQLVQMLGEHTLDATDPFKRIFDFFGGLAAMVFLSPLMAAIALALRLSGTKKILFRQVRIGAGGRTFTMLKFRTMRDEPGAAFAQARPGDQRVTKLGFWLRRSSLDELPQLFNVIRGEMSLIGPRPHAPETTVAGLNFEDAAKFYRLRYRVKPGMTGLAQIRGERGATGDLGALERRVASDLEYIETWSAWLDLMILARTVPAVFRPRNAY